MCGRRLGSVSARVRVSTVAAIIFVLLVSSFVYAANNATATVDSTKGIESLNVREIQGPETVQYVLPTISSYKPVFAYRDQASESVLNQDLALAYRYVNNNATQDSSQNTVAYVGIQISNGKHTWESSLVNYPSNVGRPTAKVIKLEDVAVSPSKTGTFFMYQRPGSNTTEAIIEWFERIPFNFGSHFENRNVFIVLWIYSDNLAREHVISNPHDAQGTENYLLTYARPISAYWQTIDSQAVSYTFFNDFMSRYAYGVLILIVSIGFAALFCMILKGATIDARYRKLFGQLVGPSERTLVFATIKCYQRPRNGRKIASKYDSLLREGFESKTFVEMLRKARDAGFLESTIGAKNDVPYLVWRSRFEAVSAQLEQALSALKHKISLRYSSDGTDTT